jgi:hypothetical protein
MASKGSQDCSDEGYVSLARANSTVCRLKKLLYYISSSCYDLQLEYVSGYELEVNT